MSTDTNYDDNTSGYLVYLFSVDKNSIVCGIDTTGELNADGNEVRTPCYYHTQEKLATVLEHMDRHAKQIDSWRTFYEWLGRGNGWAFFPVEAASVFSSHWLSPDFKIACHHLEDEEGNPMHGSPFVDSSLSSTDLPNEEEMKGSWEEMTGDAGEMGKLHHLQMEDNMVITKQPLFVL